MIRSRRLRISLWIAAGLIAGLAATVAILVVHFESSARGYLISELSRRFRSDVELGNFEVSLFPSVQATGDNLVLRLKGQPGVSPVIAIQRFTVEAGLLDFYHGPRRIGKLTLQGLRIGIPAGPKKQVAGTPGSKLKLPFFFEEIVANDATLETYPSDPGKAPLRFDIHQLTLRSSKGGRAMAFSATLNNAKPPGLIETKGEFGPWTEDQPGDTPVSGVYTFTNADLSVFNGISGILASTGKYNGQLDRIDVHGTTETPNFSLDPIDHPTPLHTEFDATVDGTNGDTELHPVRATLGDSAFEVSGTIERTTAGKRKQIDLLAVAKAAGIGGFLELATKSAKPPMTGQISFNTKMSILPGDTRVIDRLRLAGSFDFRHVAFTNADVQAKIARLSHRAEGEPKNTETADVRAQFAGNFRLRDAILDLPQLRFDVPGADVTLNGTYALKSGGIDFTGTARLHATVADMTTGIKHVLLKPLDPLFERKGAGTVLPIRITGTEGSPSFKLDIGRLLTRRDEK